MKTALIENGSMASFRNNFMRAELLSAVRIIAREVAHFQGVFTSGMPVIYDHVPGIVNQVADALSRRFAQPCTLPS